MEVPGEEGMEEVATVEDTTAAEETFEAARAEVGRSRASVG